MSLLLEHQLSRFCFFDFWPVPVLALLVQEKGMSDSLFKLYFCFFDFVDDLVSARWGPKPEPIPRPKLLGL